MFQLFKVILGGELVFLFAWLSYAAQRFLQVCPRAHRVFYKIRRALGIVFQVVYNVAARGGSRGFAACRDSRRGAAGIRPAVTNVGAPCTRGGSRAALITPRFFGAFNRINCPSRAVLPSRAGWHACGVWPERGVIVQVVPLIGAVLSSRARETLCRFAPSVYITLCIRSFRAYVGRPAAGGAHVAPGTLHRIIVWSACSVVMKLASSSCAVEASGALSTSQCTNLRVATVVASRALQRVRTFAGTVPPRRALVSSHLRAQVVAVPARLAIDRTRRPGRAVRAILRAIYSFTTALGAIRCWRALRVEIAAKGAERACWALYGRCTVIPGAVRPAGALGTLA